MASTGSGRKASKSSHVEESHPSLLQKGVRVWGQPTAYMDEVVYDWHSQLISKECRAAGSKNSQVLLSQGSFSGELTPLFLPRNS